MERCTRGILSGRAVPLLGCVVWGALLLIVIDASVAPVPVPGFLPLPPGVGVGLLGATLLGLPLFAALVAVGRMPRTRASFRSRSLAAALIAVVAVLIAFRGPLPLRSCTTALHVSFAAPTRTDSARTTYYIIGLEDLNGRLLIPASELYTNAVRKAGCALVNKGHGIWSDLPAMGESFVLEWRGLLTAPPGTSLRLRGGDSVEGSVLSVTVNGRRTDIAIGDAPDASPYTHTPVARLLGTPRYRLQRALLAGLLVPPLWMLFAWRLRRGVASCSPVVALWPGTPQSWRSMLALAASAIAAVFLFNRHIPNADLLWHDDAMWYFDAPSIVSGGVRDLWHLLSKGHIARLRTLLYSYGLLHWGVPATRMLYIGVLSLASLLLLFFYLRVLRLRPGVALASAVLPHLLPGLIGIPLGLNASYAVFSMVPMLVCCLSLPPAITRCRASGLLFGALALAAFWTGLNISSAGVFFAPCALLVCASLFLQPGLRVRSVFHALSMLVLVALRLTNRPVHSNLRPQPISWRTMVGRSVEFLRLSSVAPWEHPIVIVATVALVLLGIVLVAGASRAVVADRCPDKARLPMSYRFLLGLWPGCWMVAHGAAYIGLNPDFRAYDYVYVFSFGAVLVQLAAITWLVSRASELLRRPHRRTLLASLALTVIIVWNGEVRVARGRRLHSENEFVSSTIRDSLAHVALPVDAQVIVLTVEACIDHKGNRRVNSGLLQYLTGRRDITGLIGPSLFPNDPFRPVKGWFDTMAGLSTEQPLFVFRMVDGKLRPLRHLLRVYRNEEAGTRRAWALYELDVASGEARGVSSGASFEALRESIDRLQEEFGREIDIAFHDPACEDGLVAAADFKPPHSGSLVPGPLRFSDVATLLHVSIIQTPRGERLYVALRVEKPAHAMLRPAYHTSGMDAVKSIPLWPYADPGEVVTLRIPVPSVETVGSDGIAFRLYNAGVWPYRRLPVEDGHGVLRDELIIRPATP